jgi:TonB family protein
MRLPVAFFVSFLCTIALFSGCAKKERNENTAILGKDSLSMERIRTLAPDAKEDSIAIRSALCRQKLARTVPAGGKHGDTVAAKLAQKLTMLSGTEYSTAGAAILLDASAALAQVVRTKGSMADVCAYIDSTFASCEARVGGRPLHWSLNDKDRAALEQLDIKKDIDKILAIVLKVSDECAATLMSFVREDDPGQAKLKHMVQGLIADTTVRRPAPTVTLAKKTAANPALALKFRSQESIRDSIGRHLANLQQMYKRQLKTGDYSSGTVWVTFLVDCSGRVVDARIKKSQIANTQFLERLEKYLKIVAFKPVPKACGNMNFEFPFEFKAEEL